MSQPATAAQTPSPLVVRVGADAKPLLRTLLAHAYREEPLYQALLAPERPGYSQRVRAVIRAQIDRCFDRDHDIIGVALGDRLVGVAFIGHPGASLDVPVRLGWQLRMMVGAGLAASRRFIRFQHDVQAVVPPGPVFTVPLIGVEPQYQRQGLGRLLLNAVHEVVAEEVQPCSVLLHSGMQQVPFLQALGYRQMGIVPVDGREAHVLQRPCPASAPGEARRSAVADP